ISKSYTSSSTWPSVARDGSLIWCKPASPKQVWRLPVLNILCAPLSNSAGSIYDPPATIEVSRPVITVTVNVSDFSPSFIVDMQDSVNSMTYKGCGPRVLKCTGIEASSGFENGVHFWTMTVTFAVKWDTWDLRILDCGFYALRQIRTGDPEQLVAMGDAYHTISGPQPLDGTGHQLLPGYPEVYNRFSVYKLRDFATAFPI
ncbi:MAG: hypothetical protein K8U57_15860, partial [Planctomycetes bacterium]|nr:hypothetical protein [Planctomycetota bacterium]